MPAEQYKLGAAQDGGVGAVIKMLPLLLLAACGSTPAQLRYTPTVTVAPGDGKAHVGPVTDQRGEPDPNWLGAVRGGFGNPFKVLHGEQPATDMVRQAFSDGLAARGMLASSGTGGRELRSLGGRDSGHAVAICE